MSLTITRPVRCPACGHQYAQGVHRAIDAAKEPRLKDMLLQGSFNLSVCPQCGNQGLVTTPFLYHDAEKSLFFVFLPMNLGVSDAEQQRMVGGLTNEFMSGLEPEERRGYMLQPKVYLSLQSMVDDIMIADGITREEIDAMRERAALLQELMQIESMEDLQRKVQENQDKIDYTFFQVLSSGIERAQSQGDAQTAQALSNLRDDLLSITQPEGVEAEAQTLELGREELLEMMLSERDPEKLRRLVALARPALDYFFFQAIADRIETAEKEGNEIEAKRLSRIRETILSITDELDEEARGALTEAAGFLREAIAHDAPETYLTQHQGRLDDAFFAVLNMNIAEAQRRNDENAAKALAALGGLAARILEEKAPPEVRLINRLLRAKPEDRRQILQEQSHLINDDMLAMMTEMSGQMKRANAALAQQLSQLVALAREVGGAEQGG